MKNLKAVDVMITPVMSTSKTTSAKDVASCLLSGIYSGMPITDEDRKVIGVITEIDLLEALIEGKDLAKTTAEEVMTKEAITADIDTPIMDIMRTMKEKNIIRIPITKGGKLVGIVARRDILQRKIAPLLIVV